MADLNMAYIAFENTIKQVIDHWKMQGKVTKHDDYRNYLIGIMFRFNHEYLTIKDIINFEPTTPRKDILEETVKHIREIKFQFYAYFNAIWC